ncbi:MAG: RpiB/LacA/LacB family sugar-phosphate isomerase, partial [Clostridiales bacterium]|nr:RpiB/LacA/LacB family sugar-phosphate isomerase [Clostridiales bacterium]
MLKLPWLTAQSQSSREGINITLNKHQGVRSALCWRLAVARLARQHNDA